MIKIPQTSEYKINNRSTIQGNILSTFNMDLYTNQGKMLVSGRGLRHDSISQLDEPVAAFAYFNDRIYAVGGSGQSVVGIFYNANVSARSPFVVSAETTAMQAGHYDYSDLKVMYSTATSNTDKLYATNTEAKIYFLPYSGGVAGTWSNFAFGTAGSPRLLCPFGNRMYASDNFNTILSFDQTHTVATLGNPYTLTLNTPVSNKISISFIKVAQNRLFIGTINTTGGRGAVYVWDGVQNGVVDKIISLNSTGPLSCVVLNDVPYIIDGYGVLMKYNGAYFDEVARLPLPAHMSLYNCTAQNNDRAIHPNGMVIVNSQIHILVNALQNDTQEYTVSGIWCYDEEIGFYHKGSATNMAYNSLPTLGYPGPEVGIMQFTRAGAMMEVRSPSTISVAPISTTGSIAVNATSATLSGSWGGATGQYVFYFSNGDKRVGNLINGGTSINWTTGLTSSATTSIYYALNIVGSMIYSLQYFVDATFNYASNSSNTAIYFDDTANTYSKIGYVITPEFYSEEVESVWKKVYVKYKKLLNSTDKITIKYRTVTSPTTDIQATWSGGGGGLVLTTTQDISAFGADDEITILQGQGAGWVMRIESITSATVAGVTTYTITGVPADANTYGPTGSARARLQKWKFIHQTVTGVTNLPVNEDQFFSQGVPNIESTTSFGSSDTKIQLKVICYWTGNNELEQIVVPDAPQVRAT